MILERDCSILALDEKCFDMFLYTLTGGEEIVSGIKQIVANINIKGTRRMNMNNILRDTIKR